MCIGYTSQYVWTEEWLTKTKGFVRAAFANGQELSWCHYARCDNYKKRDELEMSKDLQKFGFTPGYMVWTLQSTHLDVPDVYITAQQATQVFYLPWACQSDPNLNGWDVICEVLPRVRPPPPMKRIMNLTLTKTKMTQENFSKKQVFPKNVSRTALLHPRTLK